MVVAGLGLGGHDGELAGCRVPQFRVENRVVVAEGHRVGLAADGHDLAVGQHHAVGEGAGIVHRADLGHVCGRALLMSGSRTPGWWRLSPGSQGRRPW